MEGVRRRNVLRTKSVVSFLGEGEERVWSRSAVYTGGGRPDWERLGESGREWERGESAFKEKMCALHQQRRGAFLVASRQTCWGVVHTGAGFTLSGCASYPVVSMGLPIGSAPQVPLL